MMHRDLKSANILLDENYFHCKICDFGVSKTRNEDVKNTIAPGTLRWTAPEQMISETYTEKVDVYAFGTILFEMVANDIPLKDLSIALLIQEVTKGTRAEIPRSCNLAFRKLITECWSANPDLRPPFFTILRLLCELPVS